MSVFMFDELVHQVRPDPEWLVAVKAFNSKNQFVRLCNELEVPIPPTQTFEKLPESDPSVQFPCFVKADVSATGMAVYEARNQSELKEMILRLGGAAFQIQEKISGERVVFLNVQYDGCDNGYAHRGEVTEQVLDGFSHVGNKCPTEFVPWAVTDPIAEKAVKMGLKGPFAFDVAAVTNGNDPPTYVVIECNPRWNAATYPTRIADKLKATSWQGRYFRPATIRKLEDIRLGHLEYDSRRKTGVVLVNWGMIAAGKVGVMLVGSNDDQDEMVAELASIMH
jgi:hypothetical protein